MHNGIYQETTAPLYRREEYHGFQNPLSGQQGLTNPHFLPSHQYQQQSQLRYNEQNGQAAVYLQQCPSSMHTVDKRKPSRLRRIFIIALLLVIISVSLSCGTMLLLFKYTDMFSTTSVPPSPILCVPCSKSANNRREIILVKTSTEGNTNDDCCVINRDLVEKFLSPIRKNTSRDASGFSNQSSNSIHAFLDAPATNKPDRTYNGMEETDYEKVKKWNDIISGAFSRPHVKLTDAKDEIYVEEAGLYVVYSRLEFNGPSTELNPGATESISLPVWFGQRLRLEKQDDYLLEDSQVKTCVSDSEGSLPCYTSQLFAVLHLPRSSRLSLEAQPVNLISDNVRNSYFGLFKID